MYNLESLWAPAFCNTSYTVFTNRTGIDTL